MSDAASCPASLPLFELLEPFELFVLLVLFALFVLFALLFESSEHAVNASNNRAIGKRRIGIPSGWFGAQ